MFYDVLCQWHYIESVQMVFKVQRNFQLLFARFVFGAAPTTKSSSSSSSSSRARFLFADAFLATDTLFAVDFLTGMSSSSSTSTLGVLLAVEDFLPFELVGVDVFSMKAEDEAIGALDKAGFDAFLPTDAEVEVEAAATPPFGSQSIAGSAKDDNALSTSEKLSTVWKALPLAAG